MAVRVFREFSDVRIGIEDVAFSAAGPEHPLATGVDLEFLFRPLRHLADSSIGPEMVTLLPIVKDDHFHLATAVEVKDFGAMRVALVETCLLVTLGFGVLGKDRESGDVENDVWMLRAKAFQQFRNGIFDYDGDLVRLFGVLDLNIDVVFGIHYDAT